MQIVKIQISEGELSLRQFEKMALASHFHIRCLPDEVYLVSRLALDFLAEHDIPFRVLDRDPFRTDDRLAISEASRNERLLELLEKHSGKLVVQKLSQSEAISLQYLTYFRPKYRYAALCLFDLKWGISQEVADMCEDLALSDPDVHVRHMAVMNLSSFYSGTGNLRIGNLFAKIIYDDKEDTRVREGAYRVLFALPEEILWRRSPMYDGLFGFPEEIQWRRPPIFGFHFPDDVDWAFVDSFVRQNAFTRVCRRIIRLVARNPFAGKKRKEIVVPSI